jgi:hypothetical protein
VDCGGGHALGPGERGVTGVGWRPHDRRPPAHVPAENAPGLKLLVGPCHGGPTHPEV